MTDFKSLIERLTDEGVKFVIIGGFAGTIHGSARSTQDLDIVYSRSADNLARLARSLGSISPYPRSAPVGLPFRWDARTLEIGTNFTLTTSVGWIDVMGDITGGGGYEQLLPYTIQVEVFGRSCLCLDLPKLIAVKRAAGRPKDFDALAELEALASEQKANPPIDRTPPAKAN